MTNEVWREERLLIDGRLVDASGGTYDNINPATESVLGVAGDGTVDDMDAAIGAARRAFDETSWSIDVELRLACLRQLHEGLERHREELRATTVAEVGCPVGLTHMAQLDTPIDGVAWLIDLLEHYDFVEDLGDAEPFGMPSHRWVQREAAGVVGAITPWNFPVQINLAKVAPALAAGCTVVLAGAGHAVTGSAARAGSWPRRPTSRRASSTSSPRRDTRVALLASTRVDLVSLTGSTATGKKVMAPPPSRSSCAFLELGGKSAAVVLDDADIAGAAGATGFQVMTHAGQGAPSRRARRAAPGWTRRSRPSSGS
ncbi:MAG: aldehyde dehydrogenase family protein [Acidimicrobiales bacterium]